MIESDMQVVLAMLLYFVVVVVIGFVYAKRLSPPLITNK